MPRKSTNGRRRHDWEAAYELPADLDFRKLRVIGVGLGTLQKHVSAKRKLVELEPDLAVEFPTSAAVNAGLRKLRQIQQIIKPMKRNRTA